LCNSLSGCCMVALLASAWIETAKPVWHGWRYGVALLASAWIETVTGAASFSAKFESRSSRARGLKQYLMSLDQPVSSVALLASAWIETNKQPGPRNAQDVALLASAWIETTAKAYQQQCA